MNPIYFDNNATTLIDEAIVDQMAAVFRSQLANPASQHSAGRRARIIIEDARDDITKALGGNITGMASDQLILTSGGTESNNLAILGLASSYPGTLVVSQIEHPSVLDAAKHWQQLGNPVRFLPVDSDGQVCVDVLARWFREFDPASDQKPISVVSVMLANNETGVIQPIPKIAELCRRHSAKFHTDAVQAVGKIQVDFTNINVDAMTFTAHKLHGPVGIGGLLVRSGVKLSPQLHGGFQQLGLRPGTEPVAMAVGLKLTIEKAIADQTSFAAKVSEIRDLLERELIDGCQSIAEGEPIKVQIHGKSAQRLPHTTSISFAHCDRQALQLALDSVGICVSTGSACASGSGRPSHVLQAMNLPDDWINSAIRFSLCKAISRNDIIDALRRIVPCVQRVRRLSGSTPLSTVTSG